MGSKSSEANSQQTTQNTDNRTVNTTTIDDRDTAWVTDLSNRSTTTNTDNSIRVDDRSDHSMKSWAYTSADYTDNSNRSVSNWTDNSNRSTYSNWQDQSIRVSDTSDRSTRNSWTDNSDRSIWQDQRISVSDTSDRSTRNAWTDNSDRSTYYSVGSDAAKINEQNTELLRDLGGRQTDAARVIAGFGFDALTGAGNAAAEMFSTSSANSTRAFDLATARSTDAWAKTVESSTGLIDSLLKGANNTVNAARDISQQAITSYQPTENKNADAMKWGLLAAAGIAALVIVPKLAK